MMKKFMKTGIAAMLTASAILLAGCIKLPGQSGQTPGGLLNPDPDPPITGMPNPWMETTEEEIEKTLGCSFRIPKGADIKYCAELVDEGLYEIDFDLDGLSYTFRVKKTDAAEDISGLYYDWTVFADTPLGENNATNYRYISDEKTVDYITWYDAKEGVTHSLSTSAASLDGFDITAIAMQIAGLDTNYFALYQPVLNETLDLIENGYDMDRDYQYISSGVMERANYGEKEEMLKSIGFSIGDLSGDGIPELVVGEDQPSEDGSKRSYIYAVYHLSDGNPEMTIEGWSRNRYNYLGNGTFFNIGSGGALYTMISFSNLSEDGSKEVIQDSYFSYDKENGEIAYYHNHSGVMDPKQAEELVMTADEFWLLSENDNYQNFEWSYFEALK